MKIGKMDFKDYAANKPLSVTSTGNFLTAKDILGQPTLQLGSLLSLPKEKQIDLAVKRYELEPEISLSIIGIGKLTKKEIIAHIKRQDDFGMTALEAEMGYCSELMASLDNPYSPDLADTQPKKPLPEIPDWKPFKKCIIIKLKTRALFNENTTDQVTTPFTDYRFKYVHPAFIKRGFNVIVLKGTDDTRTKFVPEAKNKLTVYMSGVGHGAYQLYTGHNGNHILEVGKYDPAEVSGKIIHYLSCQTAGKLGPDTVAKGAKSYLGYSENFHLVWDDPSTGVNEFLCFAESDSIIDIMLANGATALQAFNAAIATFNACLVKPGIPGTAAATWLKYDRDHLKLIGNGSSTILPYRLVKICFPIKRLEEEDALIEAGEIVEE